jgi:flagellar hook assembly protein FlgD
MDQIYVSLSLLDQALMWTCVTPIGDNLQRILLMVASVFLCLVIFILTPGATVQADIKLISDVSLSAGAFNPSREEKVRVAYKIVKDEKVTIRIYDADGGLVRTLIENVSRQQGMHEESWNGYDSEGKIVPDEAYFFTIETASEAVYDPTTLSGGVVGDITEARFDAEAGTVVYKLPAASRVLIRCGLHNGPMVKTLVDWKPRIAGSITEYWDGRDEDKVFMVRGNKDFTALITYITLPDATVITYGNDKELYRDYKLGRAKDRPQKPERQREPDPQGQLRPENLVPPAWARAPRVVMAFPQLSGVDGAVPEVRENVDVRIDVDPADRDYLLRDQFEVIFFVDNVFFTEAERGYLPLNWKWEFNQIPAGEHILTVNISSFKGQVGVSSRKVRVVKPKP